MEPGSPWLFIFLIILIMLSAFFSASETALTSLSKIRLINMVEEKVKNADKVSKLIDNPSKLLSTILVGNNVVNICASSLATSIAISYSPQAGVGIATIIMTVTLLIFGEITPKTLAAQNSEKVALFVASTISILEKIFTPVIWILNIVTGFLIKALGGDNSQKAPAITEAELKTMVNVSHEEGVLEVDERRMINNVFEFGDTKARDIMTPRTEIVAVSLDTSYEEIIEVFKEERFSRLPVYKDSIDNIIGIIHLKDIMFIDENDFEVNVYMREPFYTYESKATTELFTQMRTKSIPVAIVLDEYGGTAGLLTVEDLVEEIVGEISDEYDDEEDEIQVIKEDEYIIEGMSKIDDVNEMIGTRFESDEVDSIGGYVMEQLGRFPEIGEVVETDGVKLVIEEIDKNRISKLRVYT